MVTYSTYLVSSIINININIITLSLPTAAIDIIILN